MSSTLVRPRTTARRRRTRNADPASLATWLASWRPVLDALRTNIFLADLDLTLVFANQTAQQTLRQIEPALQQAFGISAAEIVGGSIHRFHRDPHRVERVLDENGFSLPHDAAFAFGGVTLATKINKVVDGEGRHLGYAVAWEDATDLEASNAAVRELSDHLEMAASAVEELSASIGEISRSSSEAAEASAHGVTDATAATSAVRELDDASAAIGDILGTITAITEQTNLLALNATIEAARAGEAGRGFAVVAGEVKQLAHDTAAATADIDRRIGAIRSSVEHVARSIDTIGQRLRELNELQSSVASTVEQQRLATDQLARSVTDAASSTTLR